MQEKFMVHTSFVVKKNIAGSMMRINDYDNVVVEGRAAAIKAAEKIGKFSNIDLVRDFLDGGPILGKKLVLHGTESVVSCAIIFPI